MKNFGSYRQYSQMSFEGHFKVKSLENVNLSYTGIQLHVEITHSDLLHWLSIENSCFYVLEACSTEPNRPAKIKVDLERRKVSSESPGDPLSDIEVLSSRSKEIQTIHSNNRTPTDNCRN